MNNEYRFISGTNISTLLAELNDMAREGWQLVSTSCVVFPNGMVQHFLYIGRK